MNRTLSRDFTLVLLIIIALLSGAGYTLTEYVRLNRDTNDIPCLKDQRYLPNQSKLLYAGSTTDHQIINMEMQSYSQLTSLHEHVLKNTEKNIYEWMVILKGIHKQRKNSRDVVAYLQAKYNLPEFKAAALNTYYLKTKKSEMNHRYNTCKE